MPNTQEQISFYDGFLKQLTMENSRHKRVYQSLDTLPKGKVLDLGCGAGLTSKRLADGGRDVTAIDFSPFAIAHAEKYNHSDRIKYLCADITEFKTSEEFDAICMVDVYEHLPNPWAITNLLRDASHDDTVIYLNIPYNETIIYLQENHPKVLQPIDNPVEIGGVLNLFTCVGFVPFKMELYWMQYVEYFFCTKDKFNQFMGFVYPGLK
jgi:cyclopropane fatty-acyl-phospholipid synthase-like methyltransferase